jgi:hypothetical protein
MAKHDRPFFLGGAGKAVDHEFLLEEADCYINRFDETIDLNAVGPWTERHTKLAWKYKVNSVHLSNQSLGDRRLADLLGELPVLRKLALSIYLPIELTALGQLSELEWLWIDCGMGWRTADRFPSVDLSGLGKLRHADIMLCRPFESILQCIGIQELSIRNESDGRLRDLDLSHMPKLRELELNHCPKLRTLILHPKAHVRALDISLCGSFEPDWRRIGPDLRYLVLGGRLSFPLENIVQAPNLEELHTREIRKLPPLGFLQKLPRLQTVFLFAAPPGPNVSPEDHALIEQINSRAKRQRTP